MSELDVMKFRGIVAASADGRSTSEAIQHIRERYTAELERVKDYLIDRGIGGLVQTSSRRRASVVLNDGYDLFAEFPVRGTRIVEVQVGAQKSKRQRRKLQDLTLRQLRDEVQRMEQRQVPEHNEVEVLKRLIAKVESCGDEETTVGDALRRAHRGD